MFEPNIIFFTLESVFLYAALKFRLKNDFVGLLSECRYFIIVEKITNEIETILQIFITLVTIRV